MHDPCTLAFSLPGVDIWHVDPEKGGREDSCDWSGSHRNLNAREQAIVESVWQLETILDNAPFYPDHEAHKRFSVLKEAVWKWKRRSKWRVPVRWHFWHWRINILMLGDLKRWLWSRCASCGKRFSWGYSPCSTQWDGDGPRWFRGEKSVYHHQCVEGK